MTSPDFESNPPIDAPIEQYQLYQWLILTHGPHSPQGKAYTQIMKEHFPEEPAIISPNEADALQPLVYQYIALIHRQT